MIEIWILGSSFERLIIATIFKHKNFGPRLLHGKRGLGTTSNITKRMGETIVQIPVASCRFHWE